MSYSRKFGAPPERGPPDEGGSPMENHLPGAMHRKPRWPDQLPGSRCVVLLTGRATLGVPSLLDLGLVTLTTLALAPFHNRSHRSPSALLTIPLHHEALARPGSNRLPSPRQGDALPSELRAIVERETGVEPATFWMGTRRSTTELLSQTTNSPVREWAAWGSNPGPSD